MTLPILPTAPPASAELVRVLLLARTANTAVPLEEMERMRGKVASMANVAMTMRSFMLVPCPTRRRAPGSFPPASIPRRRERAVRC